MAAYYNEFDRNAAAWLRELIRAGHLPDGDVDERSIVDVCGEDLRGYVQCHFFAGIGGWPYALRLAGWADNERVWTGSCPCQPFSSAGKRQGTADERHLWPEFARLIGEYRPSIAFGEQVASKSGREWLSGVRTDLEALGYAVGAADLCVASVGAPHIRQRLFWVAHSERAGVWGAAREDLGAAREVQGEVGERERQRLRSDPRPSGGVLRERLDNPAGARCASEGSGQPAEPEWRHGMLGVGREAGGMAHPDAAGSDRQRRKGLSGDGDAPQRNDSGGQGRATTRGEMGRARQPWQDSVWLLCLDGKARRVEPSAFPLADGVPARVGRLRGYGNAIVPPLAAEFVKAYMDVR